MDPEESLSPEHLRELLGKSLSRPDLNTVDAIIEHERKHALDLIATLGPNDAAAVLRAWPRGAKLLERARSDARSKQDGNTPS